MIFRGGDSREAGKKMLIRYFPRQQTENAWRCIEFSNQGSE